MTRRSIAWATCLALAAGGAVVAAAEDRAPVPVDLELVIAVDVSASMGRDEFLLQRDGYVDAIGHPDFLRAVRSGDIGRIALTYVEWSDTTWQRVVVPWRLIDGAESARRFARDLAARSLVTGRGTSISAALLYSATLFDGNGFDGTRKAIDLSGDGPNNYGPRVTDARDRVVAAGIVVNGLPILIDPSPVFPAMDRYYADCVAGGGGAFVLPVRHVGEFATAIRWKLIREVAAREESGPPRVVLAAAPSPADCLIGERTRALYTDKYYPGLDR